MGLIFAHTNTENRAYFTLTDTKDGKFSEGMQGSREAPEGGASLKGVTPFISMGFPGCISIQANDLQCSASPVGSSMKSQRMMTPMMYHINNNIKSADLP